jgi:uncharacterized lipoprotein YmbA
MMRSNERGVPADFRARRQRMKMKRTLTTMVFSLAALVVLTSCGGKVRYPNYYTLNLPAPPDPPPAENVHAAVAVREFRAPAYLRQGAIVYKPSPEQIGFYAYHRWAINPCEFVTNSVIAPADALPASSLMTGAPTPITCSADDWRSSMKSTMRAASRLKSHSPPR